MKVFLQDFIDLGYCSTVRVDLGPWLAKLICLIYSLHVYTFIGSIMVVP